MTQRGSDSTVRKFDYAPAVRKAVPLLIGLNSPSGGGKTYSALRLATGIQRVVGGDIAMIDTEANRGLHYADLFKFHHIPFAPPFSPMDYLAVLQFVVAKGARTIVIDSATHMHDGPGGILEMHTEELEAMGGGEKNNFRAWAKPKAQLRSFINAMTTGLGRPDVALNLLFCIRAKEKIRIEKGAREAEKLGLQPIVDPELRFEMTTNILLRNGADGVPTWQSELRSEQDIIKLPKAFRQLFAINAQLDEDMGQKMAEWSTGGDAPAAAAQSPQLAANAKKWIEFWTKRGISVDRILATIGKPSIELVDKSDLDRFDAFAKQIKAQQTTAEQLFASSAPPPDEDGPGDDKGDEPTAEEIAAMEAQKNGNGATAGKGA